MTTESAYSGDDPHRLLSSARELAQRVRRAQRATWFPLLVFAAANFAAIPVSRYGQLLGMGVLGRLVSPEAAIGVALLVLAWAECNRALLLLTLGYLAVVLVPIRFGWGLDSPWYMLPPLVTDGSVLLLGSIGFALAQRPSRLPAA